MRAHARTRGCFAPLHLELCTHLACTQEYAGAQAERPQVGVKHDAAAHDAVEQGEAVVHSVLSEGKGHAILEGEVHNLQGARGRTQRGAWHPQIERCMTMKSSCKEQRGTHRSRGA